MSDDTLKIRRKISTLTNALDALETNLTALSSQSLPELVIGLDTIQQAKLQVLIPYLVYDLVFVYLKTRGLDPKTHPVIAELDRVRQYFDKIKDAEDPAKRQLAIDKAAAARFIKNAISQAKDTTPTTVSGPSSTTHIDEGGNGNRDGDGKAPTPVIHVPAKQTEKMLEREKYHEALREEALLENEDDEQLEIIDNDVDEGGEGKGKASAVDPPVPDVSPPPSTPAGKRRRPPIDPFAGYGDDQDTRSSAASAEKDSTQSASRSGTKIRKTRKEDISAEASSGTNTPSRVESKDSVKPPRKPRKKSVK